MVQEVTITKRPASGGGKLVIVIPKDIERALGLTKDSLLEIRIKKLE